MLFSEHCSWPFRRRAWALQQLLWDAQNIVGDTLGSLPFYTAVHVPLGLSQYCNSAGTPPNVHLELCWRQQAVSTPPAAEMGLPLPCPNLLIATGLTEVLSFSRLPVPGLKESPGADLQPTKTLLVLEVQAGSEPHHSAYLVYMTQLLCVKIWSLLGDIGA